MEKRGNKHARPVLSDLRESGAIEQDADQVWFLYRPEYYDIMEDEKGESYKGVAEIGIAKNRNGSLGHITTYFEKEQTYFRDYSSNDSDDKEQWVGETIDNDDKPF